MPRVKTIKSGNVEITLTDYSKELQNSLKKGCRDGYREASKNAKKDIKAAIKSGGHIVSGRYYKSIGYSIKSQQNGFGMIVGSRYKKSHVSHLIELGTGQRFQKSGRILRKHTVVSGKFKRPKSVGKIRAYRVINGVWESHEAEYIDFIRTHVAQCVNDFVNNTQDIGNVDEED